jgi:hypothetical protein
MKEKKYRAQLLLEPRQREALAEMARREHRSISELARRVLDAGLATLQDESEVWKRRKIALRKMRLFREKIRRRSGLCEVDVIREAREEREQDMGRVWQR